METVIPRRYEWPLVISPTLPKPEELVQIVRNALQVEVWSSHLESQVSNVGQGLGGLC